MNGSLHTFLKLTVLMLSIFATAACDYNNAEEAGEKIDEIVTDAENAIEDACEDVKENAAAKDKDC